MQQLRTNTTQNNNKKPKWTWMTQYPRLCSVLYQRIYMSALCMCSCMCLHTCACIHTYTHIHSHTCTPHTDTHVYRHTPMYRYTHSHIYKCAQTCTTYTHVQTHIHTYIHTQKHLLVTRVRREKRAFLNCKFHTREKTEASRVHY